MFDGAQSSGHARANDLEAIGSDRNYDGSAFEFTFAIWPVADPSAVTQLQDTTYQARSQGIGSVPDGVLVSGRSYAWRVRAADGNGTSTWSQTCFFSYDSTAPSAPSITSDNYPRGELGPTGQLADFRFHGTATRISWASAGRGTSSRCRAATTAGR